MSRLVVVSLAALVAAIAALALALHDPSRDPAAATRPSAQTKVAARSVSTPAATQRRWSLAALVAAFAGGVACATAASGLVAERRRRGARRMNLASAASAPVDGACAPGEDDTDDDEWQMLDGEEGQLVTLHDAQGVVRYASGPLLELIGFTRQQLIGRQGRDFVHPDDLPMLLATVHAARSEAQSTPLLFRLRDDRGGYAWIEAEFRHSASRTGEPEMLCVARSVARSAGARAEAHAPVHAQARTHAATPLPASAAIVSSRAASTLPDTAPGPSLQDLCHAFERREFALHYQLKVGLSNWQVTGVEALLRWTAPEGVGRTAQIIAAAERTGFIVTLGEWVLRAAAHQSLQWRRAGLRYPVSVNVSRVQLRDPGFVDLVRELVARDSQLPAWLELEVTERALAGDSDRTVHAIAQIVALGFRLHLDDFGVGYSNLAQLSRMPLRALKIDRSLVSELGAAGSGGAVDAVLSLSRSLQLKVIAEGVESPEQLERLRAGGCDEAQGFLLSHPMSADAMRTLIGPVSPAAAVPRAIGSREVSPRPTASPQAQRSPSFDVRG